MDILLLVKHLEKNTNLCVPFGILQHSLFQWRLHRPRFFSGLNGTLTITCSCFATPVLSSHSCSYPNDSYGSMFLVQIPSKSGCHKFPCHDERKDIWKSFPNIFTFSCIHCSMTRRIITTSYALFWLFVHSPNTFCYPSNSICNCKTPMSMLFSSLLFSISPLLFQLSKGGLSEGFCQPRMHIFQLSFLILQLFQSLTLIIHTIF